LLETLASSWATPKTIQMIDATVIRAPHQVARAKGGLRQSLGHSRGGFRSKIHARTDEVGLLLGSVLMEADETRPQALIGDKSYDSDSIPQDAWFHGIDPVIPTKSNRKVEWPVDTTLCALRKRIERCFNKVKNASCVATRYDKTVDSFLAFIQLASIKIWLRFVNRTYFADLISRP
jgi:transposase